MPKQNLRDQGYVNRTGRTGVNSRYNPVKINSVPEIRRSVIHINGVPIEREKAPKGEYSDAFLRLIYNIYFTYLTSVGRTMRKKVKEMNRLEIQIKESESTEVSSNA